MRRALWPLTCLAVACGHSVRTAPTSAGPPRLALILLAGQSNMAGRGISEAVDSTPVPGIWMLDKSGAWIPAREPVHFDRPGRLGVGPGFAFARKVASACGIPIGLVPTAVGGTSVRRWVVAAFDSATNTHPWDDARARIERARADGRFVAVLWHQGEADGNQRDAPLYDGRLRDVITRIREATGAASAPFLIGGIGRWPERPWNAYRWKVDSVHRNIARTLPNGAYVSAEGLKHKGDTLHFDSPSARLLGERYADALLAGGCAALRP